MTYKCQCACKHCLYNCGPKWREWISGEVLHDALRAISTWDHRVQVHLTGGEPFLNFPLLLEAIRIAAELGIPRYVETNARWCLREAEVAEKLVALREAGLNAILISCSPFHAEKIPPVRTLLGIRKALEIFGRENVIVYLPHWVDQIQMFDLERTIPLERYVERFGLERAPRMLWDGYGIIPGGRSGYTLGHLVEKSPDSAFRGGSCREEIVYAHHTHFDLYGNYISWFFGGLAVGDWHDLPQILNDFRSGNYPPMIDLLVTGGPFRLLEMAKEEYGYQELAEGYAGKCHLCVDVRRHLSAHGDFPALRPREFYSHI